MGHLYHGYVKLPNGLGLCSNESHAMRQGIRRISRVHFSLPDKKTTKLTHRGSLSTFDYPSFSIVDQINSKLTRRR
jgi:hypothetical protein